MEDTRKEILGQVEKYYRLKFAEKPDFIPGKSRINYAGRVFDADEMVKLVDSSLDFWLTEGRFCDEFRKKLMDFLGVRFCTLVNSGSSANLIAFWTLTSHKLGERRVKRKDEVITVAAGFPTTVAPIIQYGAVPVFVDVEIGTYNIDVSLLEDALSEKTKAVFVAHTLGNPFDVVKVKEFCKKHSLWLIEDNCDSLGSKYDGRYTGTLGDIGTSSFYPAHHITCGEGGAVYTDDPELSRIIESLVGWGRDCWCKTGRDNTCGKRFGQQLGQLPFGYDHKYVYSSFGFNLKMTEMQAAIGSAQVDKLAGFIEKRKKNFARIYDGLKSLSDKIILPSPTELADPAWFSFIITIRDGKKYSRHKILEFLEGRNIQTRLLFAGNLVKQPCFDSIREDSSVYRIVGDLKNSDKIMNDTFMVGVYPGL